MDSILEQLNKSIQDKAKYVTYFSPVDGFTAKSEANFLREYGNFINDDSRDMSVPVCIGEAMRAGETLPVIAMGKLIFKSQPPQSMIDLGMDSFLFGLTWSYQETLKSLIEFPRNTPANLLCVILSQDFDIEEYYDDYPGGFSVSFRIQFPYCRLDLNTQEIVRRNAIQHLQDNNVRGCLKKEPIGKWDEILTDISSCVSIPMYGSVMELAEKPVIFQRLVTELVQSNMDSDHRPEDEDLKEYFILNNFGLVADGRVSQEEFLTDGEFYHHDWLHVFLSIHYWKAQYFLRAEYKDNQNEVDEGVSFDDPKKVLKLMLKWISRQRANERGDWERIGQALYYESEGTDDGLDMWAEFTASAPGSPFDLDECYETYHTFSAFRRTILTLEYYASRDSPEEYRKWHQLRCLDKLEYASKCPELGPIAEAFHVCYRDKYLFDGTPNGWWSFGRHTWLANASNTMKNTLSDNRDGFRARFLQLRESLNRTIGKLGNDDPRIAGLDNQIENIAKIMRILNDPTKKSRILAECERLYEVLGFDTIKDSHFELMGCKDCVIDTSGDKATIRDGMPEDYVTLQIRHCLRSKPLLTHDSKSVESVKLFLMMTFPDKDVRHAVKMLEASFLRGGNQHKIIPMGTGARGDEGKSAWKRWIEEALGPYAGTISAAVLLTGRVKDASNATPELMSIRTCNVLIFSETDDGMTFDPSKVKGLSGGDIISGRALFKGMENFRQRSTIVGLCNQPPRLPENADDPMKRRFGFIFPFVSRFVPKEEAPLTLTEQLRQRIFPRDNHFDQVVERMGRAKLWLMVQNYAEYYRNGLGIPDTITKLSIEYWDASDVYGRYIQTNLVITKNTDDVVPFSMIYTSFRTWYGSYYPNRRCPNGDTFQSNMSSRIGKLNKMMWSGIRFGNAEGGATPQDDLKSTI